MKMYYTTVTCDQCSTHIDIFQQETDNLCWGKCLQCGRESSIGKDDVKFFNATKKISEFIRSINEVV